MGTNNETDGILKEGTFDYRSQGYSNCNLLHFSWSIWRDRPRDHQDAETGSVCLHESSYFEQPLGESQILSISCGNATFFTAFLSERPFLYLQQGLKDWVDPVIP